MMCVLYLKMGVIDFSLYLKDNVGMDASLDADRYVSAFLFFSDFVV